MGYIRLEKDADGIIELILDQPGQTVNTMGFEYIEAMTEAVDELQARIVEGGVTGIYIRSGKPSFFGGGDLNVILETPTEMTEEEATKRFKQTMAAKAPLRKLELLGVPVAVGINGAAMGGGYEICLACHHRVAINKPSVQVGLPEAQLGLMPGCGGIVRGTRKFGCQNAVTWFSSGKSFNAEKALANGWVDDLADSEEDMHVKAKAWIKANPNAKQPWDMPGFKIPGGAPNDKDAPQELLGLFYLGAANVMNQTMGNMPSSKAILACVHDVARVDFDTAEKIEVRYFMQLASSQVAKNMIRTFFFHLNQVNGGASRPADIEKTRVNKLGILGAGQMGAAIALAAAKGGIEVVLKDISQENADRGKGYAVVACKKNKRLDEAKTVEILNRIIPSTDNTDLAGCDLVIEAVFENRELKAAVIQQTEAVTDANCILASNTSALPITELAQASSRPETFIGMHFFSPADKMPLVEIICGEKTSKETLARTFDLARVLGKTPIIVNDGPGFFTTRVIGTTVTEGAAMVMEGVNPVLIERAARLNGSPVGPLAAIDEISQETAHKNGKQLKADVLAQGKDWVDTPASILIGRMVEEFDRHGKVFGGGYYDYPEGGKKHIWPGLKEHFAPNGYTEIPLQDIQDRLIFCQSLESVRAMEDGVVNTAADGNIGSIFGIGFPPQAGGAFQFINAYGVRQFAKRARELAEKYGPQFEPPGLLLEKAKNDEQFL